MPVQCGGIDRLAVVVRVEDDRALGAGDGPLAVDGGRRLRIRRGEQPRFQPLALEHRNQRLRRAPQPRRIGRNVGDGQKVSVLREHGVAIE